MRVIGIGCVGLVRVTAQMVVTMKSVVSAANNTASRFQDHSVIGAAATADIFGDAKEGFVSAAV
jgi:hypothetical protein